MLNAYIYEGLRTPFGRYAGTLAKVRPDDLLAGAIRAVMAKTAFKAEQIEVRRAEIVGRDLAGLCETLGRPPTAEEER